MIRPAQERDIPALRDIERRAGAAFAEIGMREVAEDEPPSAGTLRGYVRDGRAWVHDHEGAPVAYVLVDPIDGCAHIEQLSVRPDHARRRLGARLVDHVDAWAARSGAAALTLTTFTEVPWNGPYYLRLGFRRLPDTEVTPGLRALRRAEAEHGLDRWPRMCMRRELGDTQHPGDGTPH
ncbi:GNAT family N-acetyltransferase [Streptomyces sp. SID8352]|uniref:GNAT family N-acetyltransferase n=1 Tax=Streptomyces sp. SID8352 TaxID=2690338 RepID=UPI00136B7277|nr:GNAT family N-acetyltransferase [Streptomyces sp. SID8352]MYU24237.1 GNAT family N-acetyltransferase [Streptomyces sp. SID8352]